ncbi:MAG: hypothetical protein EPO26_06235 [Chloroflexota bacterium]|nr:MAG: hypothetical protein EPO26_06235 [Chloroflexota bacterium]
MERDEGASATVTNETGTRRNEVVIRLPDVRAWFESQVPEEFFGHLRAARREHLLAIRSLVDAAIERTDKTERSTRRVEIEVD